MVNYYDGARAEEIGKALRDRLQATPEPPPPGPTLGELLEAFRLAGDLRLTMGEKDDLRMGIKARLFGLRPVPFGYSDEDEDVYAEVVDDDE